MQEEPVVVCVRGRSTFVSDAHVYFSQECWTTCRLFRSFLPKFDGRGAGCTTWHEEQSDLFRRARHIQLSEQAFDVATGISRKRLIELACVQNGIAPKYSRVSLVTYAEEYVPAVRVMECKGIFDQFRDCCLMLILVFAGRVLCERRN